VVLCSNHQEWRTHAEIIAKRGRPMLVVGPSASDLQFLKVLATANQLSEHIDGNGERYYLWRMDAPLNA
jgi:hypothetical protein